MSTGNKGAIFCLHRIVPRDGFSKWNQFIELTPTQLEKLIISLQKMDVVFVNLQTVHLLLTQKQTSNKRFVHFSLDDGYEDNYQYAFPIFRKYAIPFSVFVSTDFIDTPNPFIWWYSIEEIVNNELEFDLSDYGVVITKEDYLRSSKEAIFLQLKNLFLNHVDSNRGYFQYKTNSLFIQHQLTAPTMLNWVQLIEMHQSGICEIGAHTHTHARFSNIDMHTKELEVNKNKQIIESHTGIACRFFAYPYGHYTDIVNWQESESVMKKCGIDLALTTIPSLLTSSSSLVQMPRVFLNEMSNSYTLLTRISGVYQKNTQWDI